MGEIQEVKQKLANTHPMAEWITWHMASLPPGKVR
jgi:hypothetical protein